MGSYRLHRLLPCAGLFLLFITQVVGCDDDNDSVGPCVHTYEDPILEISVVRDSQTEEVLASVLLTDFTIDAAAVHASALIDQFANNVELRGDSLYCTPPAGFGTQEGHYEFTATAAGYTANEISFAVQYQDFEGGCPSFNRGSFEIEIELDPK